MTPNIVTKDLKKKALKAIKQNNLILISEVPAFLGISRASYYNHKLNVDEDLESEIEKNRVKMKTSLRGKWYESENATVQVALYKLICDEDEAHRLNGSKKEITQEIVNHNQIMEELENED